ncbi:hypothetical protein GGX14DRAFT_391592 [Mycena pura]|uniref:Uncharacterized protein n=1 Tax=Mycena pura TaxID=153505 RepID=A0AAD6VKP7_9AGAR|nr:hypothetical protein GGX14DRAFT_391592 [Mycena pura]
MGSEAGKIPKDSTGCGDIDSNSHPNGNLRLVAKLKTFVTNTDFIFQPEAINTAIQANGHASGRVRVKIQERNFSSWSTVEGPSRCKSSCIINVCQEKSLKMHVRRSGRVLMEGNGRDGTYATREALLSRTCLGHPQVSATSRTYVKESRITLGLRRKILILSAETNLDPGRQPYSLYLVRPIERQSEIVRKRAVIAGHRHRKTRPTDSHGLPPITN